MSQATIFMATRTVFGAEGVGHKPEGTEPQREGLMLWLTVFGIGQPLWQELVYLHKDTFESYAGR